MHVCNIIFCVSFVWNSRTGKNIKMLKRKSDNELEILEKLVKKQIDLVLILVVLPVLTKQRTTAKQRKHPLQCQDY